VTAVTPSASLTWGRLVIAGGVHTLTVSQPPGAAVENLVGGTAFEFFREEVRG
jgi:hypothetical protein